MHRMSSPISRIEAAEAQRIECGMPAGECYERPTLDCPTFGADAWTRRALSGELADDLPF
jgi:hypothetical protein